MRNEPSGEQRWTELGRVSPRLPLAYYPTTSRVEIKKGDILAARCTVLNPTDHALVSGYAFVCEGPRLR